MIGPHLTPENQLELLGRAKFRTKKELAKLIRELNPLPQVPDRIEPLGPSLPRALRAPTWPEFAASLRPAIRDLPVGERPRDWVTDGFESADGGGSPPAGGEAVRPGDETRVVGGESLPVGPVPADLPPVTGPQHYQLLFSTVEEHVQLIERARDLLARERPGATLGELHLEAMKLLVATLEKRKFAVTDRPKKPKQPVTVDARQPSGVPRRRVPADARQPSEAPRQRVSADAREASEPLRQRGRYIPAAVRREVYRRDGGRCMYVDERGERCCETRYLEVHHLQPFAKQGGHVASNLALRCRAHNQLEAEHDFGPGLMARRGDSPRHEAGREQVDVSTKA